MLCAGGAASFSSLTKSNRERLSCSGPLGTGSIVSGNIAVPLVPAAPIATKFPAILFAVKAGEVAIPASLVVAVAGPANVPLGPDEGTENVTGTPATGLPTRSFTCA